jgi:hypothetical protein
MTEHEAGTPHLRNGEHRTPQPRVGSKTKLPVVRWGCSLALATVYLSLCARVDFQRSTPRWFEGESVLSPVKGCCRVKVLAVGVKSSSSSARDTACAPLREVVRAPHVLALLWVADLFKLGGEEGRCVGFKLWSQRLLCKIV